MEGWRYAKLSEIFYFLKDLQAMNTNLMASTKQGNVKMNEKIRKENGFLKT